MGIGQRIRNLDVFKKVPEDLSQATNVGGCISLLTVCLISFFLYTEIYTYVFPRLKGSIELDALVTKNQMTINLDIEFPRFPCQIISLDLQDIMLSHHPNIGCLFSFISGSVRKYRLSSTGERLDSSDFELLREPNQQKQYEMAKQAFQKNYGCRVVGSFTVKEVPGNFHISSHGYQNIYARLSMQNHINSVDVSHKINELYFGEISNIQVIEKQHPEAVLTKLHGHTKDFNLTRENAHSYTSHYHIDIVPTVYKDHYFKETTAYQYTYNYNSFEVYHMPVVWFNYYIGGLTVSVLPQKDGISLFLIRLCAVIGGIYTLANFISNWFLAMFRKNSYQLIN